MCSLNNTPLDAYKPGFRHAFTCQVSQRSSFDDSFTETFNPFMLSSNPAAPRISFIGEGLFKPEDIDCEQEATDVETNLIEQSMHHIQSLLCKKSQASSVSHSTCDEKRSPPRRLRVFQEITANQIQIFAKEGHDQSSLYTLI